MKKRDKYYTDLADQKNSKNTDQNSEDELENSDDENLDDQDRENMQNEKLLKRLYEAAQADIDANGGGDHP